MPEIDFVQPDGSTVTVDAPTGISLMKAAVAASVRGILAECGGQAMCATCHVYIPDTVSLPPIGEDEDEMLDCTTSQRTDRSRLSCQVTVTDDMDRSVVTVPVESS